MIQNAVIGLVAGLAAALLFGSVLSGSLAAILLFYLAPLPILVAALGWSHAAGLIAAAARNTPEKIATIAVADAAAVVSFGAWWLGYLTLLARPASKRCAADLEWYPVGRLVLWAAAIGTLLVVAALPNFGTDYDTLQAGLRRSYERLVHDQRAIDLLVLAAPPAAAACSTFTNVLNLWLAACIVKASGRLKRPWPDLTAFTLPPATPGLLAAAIGASFLPDLFGILSSACAASVMMAFAILGFAVLHSVTTGMNGRAVVVTSAYAAAVVLGWPLLLIAITGLVDIFFNIRLRVAQRRRPPSLRT